MTTQVQKAVIHVRFEGKSHDIPVSEMDIGQSSTDEQIKTAVAGFLEVDLDKLENYVVTHHKNGNFTIRPEAVFG